MTTDVTSTKLVSADGVLIIPLVLEVLLDEAVEVVVNDEPVEVELDVETVRVCFRSTGLLVSEADGWVDGSGEDVVAADEDEDMAVTEDVAADKDEDMAALEDEAGATFPMEAITVPSAREKKSFDVSQHPSPPASAASGRLASQQYLPGLHSRTASFPDAVLSIRSFGQREHNQDLSLVIIPTVSTDVWAVVGLPSLIGTLKPSVDLFSKREDRVYRYIAHSIFRCPDSKDHLTNIANSKDSRHYQIWTSRKADPHRLINHHWDSNKHS